MVKPSKLPVSETLVFEMINGSLAVRFDKAECLSIVRELATSSPVLQHAAVGRREENQVMVDDDFARSAVAVICPAAPVGSDRGPSQPVD